MNQNELIEWIKEEKLYAILQGYIYGINIQSIGKYQKNDFVKYSLTIPYQNNIENLLVDFIENWGIELFDIEIDKPNNRLIIKNLESVIYKIESPEDVLASQVESDFIQRQGE